MSRHHQFGHPVQPTHIKVAVMSLTSSPKSAASSSVRLSSISTCQQRIRLSASHTADRISHPPASSPPILLPPAVLLPPLLPPSSRTAVLSSSRPPSSRPSALLSSYSPVRGHGRRSHDHAVRAETVPTQASRRQAATSLDTTL